MAEQDDEFTRTLEADMKKVLIIIQSPVVISMLLCFRLKILM